MSLESSNWFKLKILNTEYVYVVRMDGLLRESREE